MATGSSSTAFESILFGLPIFLKRFASSGRKYNIANVPAIADVSVCRFFERSDAHAQALEMKAHVRLMTEPGESSDSMVVDHPPEPGVKRIAEPQLVCIYRKNFEFNTTM